MITRGPSWCILAICITLSHSLQYQPVPLTGVGDSECALVLNGPGRSSNFDYSLNLLRGNNQFGYNGPHTCITYDAVNAAYIEARKRVQVAQPHGDYKPEDVATVGELLLDMSVNLARTYGLSYEDIEKGLPLIDTSKSLVREICPPFLSNVECRPGKYRRYDGLCTNLENPTWGSTMQPFTRLIGPLYADGMTAPRISVTGNQLPLARVVSRTMHPDEGFHDHAGTVMVIAWGQFIDHDYTLTATPLDPLNRNDPEECCKRPPHLKNPYCNEILVPEDDYFYRLWNVRCIDFVRGFPAARPGCRLGSRSQFNTLTGTLDANTVYGVSEKFARKLRSGYGGQLRMNPVFRDYGLKDLLPLKLDIPDEGCTRPNRSMYCFEAGEIRVNEQLVLTCMHTLMAREHNRITQGLQQVNPHWDDETLFQEARRINIAEVQHITYNEFLPILLGKEVMEKFGLLLQKDGYWDGYDSHVNPNVIDAFAAAAYRFGHSLLPTAVERWSKAHKFIASKRLSDLIRRPYDLYRAGVFDEYFMGLMNQVAQAMDDSITQEVTNHLFKKVGAKFGMDLVSFNMQRGREFGLPGYMEFRKFCGLPGAETFDELFGSMPNDTVRRYSSIFEHPSDVDLWSGGVSERPLPGSMLGPTFACIIATQFSYSRRGDRFWYELPNQPSSFTPEQLHEIRKARLARVICDNTDLIDTIQLYPMVLPDHEINPRVPCRSGVLPSIDFSKWADPQPFHNKTEVEVEKINIIPLEEVVVNKTVGTMQPPSCQDPYKTLGSNIITKTKNIPKTKYIKILPPIIAKPQHSRSVPQILYALNAQKKNNNKDKYMMKRQKRSNSTKNNELKNENMKSKQILVPYIEKNLPTPSNVSKEQNATQNIRTKRNIPIQNTTDVINVNLEILSPDSSTEASIDQISEAITIHEISGTPPTRFPKNNAPNYQPFTITNSDYKENSEDTNENLENDEIEEEIPKFINQNIQKYSVFNNEDGENGGRDKDRENGRINKDVTNERIQRPQYEDLEEDIQENDYENAENTDKIEHREIEDENEEENKPQSKNVSKDSYRPEPKDKFRIFGDYDLGKFDEKPPQTIQSNPKIDRGDKFRLFGDYKLKNIQFQDDQKKLSPKIEAKEEILQENEEIEPKDEENERLENEEQEDYDEKEEQKEDLNEELNDESEDEDENYENDEESPKENYQNSPIFVPENENLKNPVVGVDVEYINKNKNKTDGTVETDDDDYDADRYDTEETENPDEQENIKQNDDIIEVDDINENTELISEQESKNENNAQKSNLKNEHLEEPNFGNPKKFVPNFKQHKIDHLEEPDFGTTKNYSPKFRKQKIEHNVESNFGQPKKFRPNFEQHKIDHLEKPTFGPPKNYSPKFRKQKIEHNVDEPNFEHPKKLSTNLNQQKIEHNLEEPSFEYPVTAPNLEELNFRQPEPFTTKLKEHNLEEPEFEQTTRSTPNFKNLKKLPNFEKINSEQINFKSPQKDYKIPNIKAIIHQNLNSHHPETQYKNFYPTPKIKKLVQKDSKYNTPNIKAIINQNLPNHNLETGYKPAKIDQKFEKLETQNLGAVEPKTPTFEDLKIEKNIQEMPYIDVTTQKNYLNNPEIKKFIKNKENEEIEEDVEDKEDIEEDKEELEDENQELTDENYENFEEIHKYEPIHLGEADTKENIEDEDDEYEKFRKTSKNDYLDIKRGDFSNADTPYDIHLAKDFYEKLYSEDENDDDKEETSRKEIRLKKSSKRNTEEDNLQVESDKKLNIDEIKAYKNVLKPQKDEAKTEISDVEAEKVKKINDKNYELISQNTQISDNIERPDITTEKYNFEATLEKILEKKDAISRTQNLEEDPKNFSNYWSLEYIVPH